MWFGINIFLMIWSQVFIWGFDNLAAGLFCIGGQVLCLIFAVIDGGE